MLKTAKRMAKRSLFCVGLVRSLRALRTDVSRLKSRLRRGSAVKAYFRDHTLRRLQLGTGRNVLKGWLNTDLSPKSGDVVYMDATQPFALHVFSFA